MITSLSIGRGGLGRFGNMAFTIASTIGIAVKSGQPYSFPRWQTHDNALFGQPVDDIGEYLLNPLPSIPEGITFQDYGYFWGYRDINLPTGNWSIDAHLQSEKYFLHCIALVRQTFTFKDEPEQNDWVAIHYRAGDYQEGDDCYHPRCNAEYYVDAINQFPIDQKFVIFSDDLQQAVYLQEALCFLDSRRVVAAHPEINYIEDFKLMKNCKSFITANSSFSLMAAILGAHSEKKIICPSRWFGSAAGNIDTKDIYPQGAIII